MGHPVYFHCLLCTVRGSDGDRDRLKTGAMKGGSVCFFGTLNKHIMTPLKQALLERNKEKMCEAFPWRLGCCSLVAEDMRKQWNQTAEAKAATALDHCAGLKLGHGLFSFTVSPLHLDAQRCIAHCGELITVCVPALVLHTYLLLGCEEWKETFILDLTLLDHSPQEMWVNIQYIHKSSYPLVCWPRGT